MVGKIQISWFVERNKMYVHMRNINTHHSFTNLNAGTNFF